MERNNQKCKIHPNEFLTNICIQSNCFIQLCAACICDHTEAHNCLNTKPKYELIKNIYEQSYENLNSLNELVSVQKSRLNNVIGRFQAYKNQAFQLLAKARQQTLQVINKTFDELQQNYKNHIEQQKNKSGLMSQSRFNQLYSELNHKNIQIYNISQQLKGTTHASTSPFASITQTNFNDTQTSKKSEGANKQTKSTKIIKKINSQFIPYVKRYVEQVSRQIAANQQFYPCVTYRNTNLSQVITATKKLISTTISYSLPNCHQLSQINNTLVKLPNGHQQNQFRNRSSSKNNQILLSPMVTLTTRNDFMKSQDKQARIRLQIQKRRQLSAKRNNAPHVIELKSPRNKALSKYNYCLTAKQNYFPSNQQYNKKLFLNTRS